MKIKERLTEHEAAVFDIVENAFPGELEYEVRMSQETLAPDTIFFFHNGEELKTHFRREAIHDMVAANHLYANGKIEVVKEMSLILTTEIKAELRNENKT